MKLFLALYTATYLLVPVLALLLWWLMPRAFDSFHFTYAHGYFLAVAALFVACVGPARLTKEQSNEAR